MILSSKEIAISVMKRIGDGEDVSSVFDTTYSYLAKYKLEPLFYRTLVQLKLLAEREEVSNTNIVSISHDIDEKDIKDIFQNLGLDKDTKFRKEIDKDLIAGFVIKSKDKLYSYNLKKYLEDIKQEIAK